MGSRLAASSLLIACIWLLAAAPAGASPPPWVEPRALNIADIAGQAPDKAIQGTIIAFTGYPGMSRFRSSRTIDDVGPRLEITADLTPHVWGSISCFQLLGQPPEWDHPGSAAPEAWVRVWSGQTELTTAIHSLAYYEPRLMLPEYGSGVLVRYPITRRSLRPDELRFETHGLYLPANMGGWACLHGDHPALTATYTVRPQNRPTVTYLGTQMAAFQSYIGKGYVGVFAPLMEQMRARYGDRHERIMLAIPDGANYVMFVYPPMPFFVVKAAGDNWQRPSSGTVRLSPGRGMLSQDLMHGGAFPLRAVWQDADQVVHLPGRPDLPAYHLSLLPQVNQLTPPEYVVLAGTPYHRCFVEGGCPNQVLESIYQATSEIKIVYLRVDAPPISNEVLAIHLRYADDSWSRSIGAGPLETATQAAGLQTIASPTGFRLFLPLMLRLPVLPYGLFDRATGRMLGYVP